MTALTIAWFALPASAQTVDNGSLEPIGVASEVPNPVPLDVPGWTFGDPGDLLVQTQVAAVGIPVYCEDVLQIESPTNVASGYADFHFAHAEALNALPFEESNEWLSTKVRDLTPGAAYNVVFEASIVRHIGQSPGFWRVTLGNEVLDAPHLVLPQSNPGQQDWTVQTVGPFSAPGPTADLLFEAVSTAQDSTVGGSDSCGLDSVPGLAQLLLDGVRLVGDSDEDGLFDDEDPCPTLAGLPGDQDEDGLEDVLDVPSVFGTDPCNPDSDFDGLEDGEEVRLGNENPEYGENCPDPTLADSDGDSLSDSEELTPVEIQVTACDLTTTGSSTMMATSSPCAQFSDGDEWDDGQERAAGTHPDLSDTDGDQIDDHRDPDPLNCEEHCDDSDEWLTEALDEEIDQCCEEGDEANCDEKQNRGSSRLAGGRCGCTSGPPWGAAAGLLPLLLFGLRRRGTQAASARC